MRRPMAALAGMVALLVACTSPPVPPELPAPTPTAATPAPPLPPVGLRVGLVFVDGSFAGATTPDALRASLEALPEAVGAELSTVRVVAADSSDMAADAAALLAARGYDITCLLGSGAALLAEELARLYPAQWFCAAPGREVEEPPDNVIFFDLRLEEVGHLLGLTAVLVSDPQAPIALVDGTRQVWGDRLLEGMRAGAGDREILMIDATSSDGVSSGLARLREAGGRAVIIDAGAPVAEVVAEQEDVLVAAPFAALDEVPADRTLMRWEVDLSVALRAVIDRVRGTSEALSRTMGLSDDVLLVELGGGLAAPLHDVVGRARAELAGGQRDPRMPAPEHAGSTPRPTAPGSPAPTRSPAAPGPGAPTP